MKKIIITIFFLSFVGFFNISNNTAFAQTDPPLDYSGFVKCDGVVNTEKDASGNLIEDKRTVKCDFNALINTINELVKWLFIITIPVATVLFAYGGLLYLTGSQNNIGKAKAIFTSVGKGFIIMLVAWVIVYTLVNWLIDPEFKGATTLIEQKK